MDSFEMEEDVPVVVEPRVDIDNTKPSTDAKRVTSGNTIPPHVIGQGADQEAVNGTRPRLVTPPGRAMPASEEAEQHVLACCLLDGSETDPEGRLTYATLTRAIEHNISPASFYWPANQVIFERLLALRAAGQPVNLEVLAEDLSGARLLEQIGGFPYLMQVTGKIPTTAHAGYFIQKLREKHLLREVIRTATGAVEQAYQATDPAELLQVTQARLSELASRSTKEDRRTTVLAKLDSRRVSLATKPAEPQTRLYLAKKPVSTPGNLTTLISKAKTGKTAAIGGAVAAIIAAHHDNHSADTLGFTAPHTKEAVLVLDTEQSPYDAWVCHERMTSRAGVQASPPWLLHHSLVGYTALELREALPLALESAKAVHGGIFTVILDGVADFVASVNDEAECNTFVASLHGLAVEFNCAIICVIHSNEALKSGDDGRGHLGKQLTRKAESNLLLKKTGEVTAITSEKQRKAPITEADQVAFRWSDEHQRHVSCGTSAQSPTGPGRPPKYDQAAMLSCFPAKNEKGAGLQQVYRAIGQLPCGISDRAFKDWVAKWIETGEVIRDGDRKVGFAFRRGV